MNHPEIVLVVARAQNGVIGANGDMPWRIPADLRHFKQLTKGRPMIMGRKTFDSLPGILDGRRHIVITRDTAWDEDGAEVVHSAADALKRANGPHVCIIGGAEIYRLFLDQADKIELTEVHASPQGDTMLEAFDPAIWQEAQRTDHAAAGGTPAYSFVTLVRRNAE
jgi:dihydrofolate reductase